MRLPRRFIWEAEDDSTSTHLALRKGAVYPTSAVSDSILVGWARDGKVRFLEVDGEDVPRDVVIEVHDASVRTRGLEPKAEGGSNG